jgi:hypothetical protein
MPRSWLDHRLAGYDVPRTAPDIPSGIAAFFLAKCAADLWKDEPALNSYIAAKA